MIEERDPGPFGEPFRFEARLGGGDRIPSVAMVLIALFVGFSIVKPWPTSGAPAVGPAEPVAPERVEPVGSGPSSVRGGTGGGPAQLPTGGAVAEMCLDPGSWRTATIETWRDQTVRVWRAVDPLPASRPLDPGIPVVPAVGTSVSAIGYCAPTSGPNQPHGPASVQAWRVDGDAVQAIELRQIAPEQGVSPYGALFGPPAELGSTKSWPDGLVVFRYEELETRASRWFAIEVSGTAASP
jgi:hypothetical protein